MQKDTKWLIFIAALVLIFAVSCGDDDDDAPSTPATPADVAGVWNLTGSVTRNDCEWIALNLPEEGEAGTQGVTIIQNGTILEGTSTGGAFFGQGWTFSGTVTSRTFELSLLETENGQADTCGYTLTGGMRATDLVDNSTGTGTVFYDIIGIDGDCSGKQCSVIMTGAWTQQ